MQSRPSWGETGNWVFLSIHSVLSQKDYSLELLMHPNRTASLFCVAPGDSWMPIPYQQLALGDLGTNNSWMPAIKVGAQGMVTSSFQEEIGHLVLLLEQAGSKQWGMCPPALLGSWEDHTQHMIWLEVRISDSSWESMPISSTEKLGDGCLFACSFYV